MDFLLLAVAVIVLLLGGFGISRLLLPNRSNGGELFALSFLFGSAIVSLSLFVFGFFVSGIGLRLLVTVECIALGWIGWRHEGFAIRLRELCPEDRTGKLLLAINIVQVVIVGWLSSVRVLGWDGLFNFEVKARLAFLNGGVIPLEYFSDPSRTWTLQSYPLMLPMTESWLYLWLGRADQQLVKIVFLLFFIAALCLLNAGNRLLGVCDWRRLVAPLLIFTAPLLIVGDGSGSSGYADFPMAVFYLAAVIYLAEFWQSGNYSALRTAAAIAACGCWLKQDGAILWLCVVAMASIKLVTASGKKTLSSTKTHEENTKENKSYVAFLRAASCAFVGKQFSEAWIELAKAALPGLLILTGWQLFMRFFSLPEISQFSPLSVATLRGNLWRVPVIAQAVVGELTNLRHWGALWLIALAAIVWLFWRWNWSEALLPFAVLLPLAFYSGIYVFSLWPSFITHLESSLPRLLIQISLVAVLMVGFTLSTVRNFDRNA